MIILSYSGVSHFPFLLLEELQSPRPVFCCLVICQSPFESLEGTLLPNAMKVLKTQSCHSFLKKPFKSIPIHLLTHQHAILAFFKMYFVPISFYVGSIVAHIMTVKYCIFPFKSISSFVTSNDICCLEVFYDLLIIFSCFHGSRIAPTALPVPDILPSHHSYETLFYILKSVSLTVPNKEIRKILLVLKPKQSCCWVVCGRGQELSSGRKFLWVAVFLWESWP